jgi:nucleoid-associated protein YgaU
MLRILTISTAFLAVTTGLLLLQPGTGPSRNADLSQPDLSAAPAQVSRAETDLVELTPAAAAPLPQPALATPAPATSPTPAPADRLGQVVALASAPATAAPTATSERSDDDLRRLTAGVLAGLGATTASAAPADDMQQMTATVLASLTAATAPRASEPASLETLVVQAMRQGQSDAYLDALLNEAAGKGQITVPQSLVTSTGRVDTATLLASLVERSQPQPATAPQVIAGGDGVEVRVVQRAGRTVQYNFYTVQSGDSLGAIAHKFYGDARLYSAIFDANRQFLSSPDRIRVGQRLSIPAPEST